MTRTCHLKCDACGRETHKHETLEALQTDAQGWDWREDGGHVCSDCRPPRAPVDSRDGKKPLAPTVAAALDWDAP